MKAILLAAGKSTRAYPLTSSRPKSLLPILHKPLIHYTIEGLKDVITEWVIVLGYEMTQVQHSIKQQFPDLNTTFVEMPEITGTGQALRDVESVVKEGPFIVLNGDDLYHPSDVKRLIATSNPYAVLVHHVEHPERFGVFRTEGDIAVELVEKPTHFVSNLANVGCYKFDGAVFNHDLQLSERGEYEIVDYVNYLLRSGKQVELVPIEEYWLPVTYPWDILVAQHYFLDKADMPHLVHPTAQIDSTAFLGENVVVGANVVIKENVELEHVCLFDDVIVESNSRIVDSVLAEGVHVKADTIVDGRAVDCVMLPVGNNEPREVKTEFKGVFCEAGTALEGFIMEPTYITKEK